MNKAAIFISIVTIVALVVLVIVMPTHRSYDWNTRDAQSHSGGQPYDDDLFNEFLKRSLPQGFSTLNTSVDDNIEIQKTRDGEIIVDTGSKKSDKDADDSTDNDDDDWLSNGRNSSKFDQKHPAIEPILNAPTDTAVMMVLHNEYPAYEMDIMATLYLFASRGGHAVIVAPNILDCSFFSSFYSNDKPFSVNQDGSYSQSRFTDNYVQDQYPIYSKEWLKCRKDTMLSIIGFDRDTIQINARFVPENIEYKRLGEAKYYYSELHEPYNLEIMALEGPKGYPSAVFAIRLYFPESGGVLTYSTMHLYFCNLGLTLPDSEKVIGAVMDDVADMPVRRIYHSDSSDQADSRAARMMEILESDKALRTTWYLILLTAVLLLVSGLYRMRPVNRNKADTLDYTDAVAVRDYKFRHSPLLHFIFQCSWLYKSGSDYRDLFVNNYLRLARVVKNTSGIELASADDEDIRQAATVLSSLCDISEKSLEREMKWMNKRNLKTNKKVNAADFSRSQALVEKLPFA